MATGLINSGVSGLQVAQLGLATTSHNIANASTAGYNRQRIVQASNVAMATGSGFIGQGANVSTIERMYSRFLNSQVNSAQTEVSSLDAYYAQISQIDNMLADTSSGLSPALQDFFTGVQQVAANPSQVPSRQAMVSSAQALVARFQGLNDQLSQMYDSVNGQITSTVSAVNSYATQIGSLNEQIIIAQSSNNQPANDLLDQRDQLVAELNKLIKVTTTTNTDGSFNVFIGTGQQLVVGTQVSSLAAMQSSADASRITVGLKTYGGNQELPESLISGGSLGGLLSFRSETLDKTANDLGRSAASLALTFNAQYALGQDLLGQVAGDTNFVSDFFTISQPTVVANGNNTSAAVVLATLAAPSIDGSYALSWDSTATPPYALTRQSDGKIWAGDDLSHLYDAQGNLPGSSEGLDLTAGGPLSLVDGGAAIPVYGTAASTANYYTKLTNSDYQLSYNGSGYSMVRLSDGKQWPAVGDPPYATLNDLSTAITNSEGFSITLGSGPMNAGDSFLIKPVNDAARNIAVNPTVAADVRLINAAMPFKTAVGKDNSGTGTISAGVTIQGFDSAAIPTGGLSISYTSNTVPPGTLTLTGATNISVTVGSSTTVYPGPNIPYTSGATISFAGISFSITGNLTTGDTFSLAKNTAGVSDARNALLLGKLQTQKTMSGATATYQTAYAQLVSDIGNKARQISVNSDAQQALLEQSQAAQQSLSGVNLDEEAANLIKYQQAYQASAKALKIGTDLFDTILGIMN